MSSVAPTQPSGIFRSQSSGENPGVVLLNSSDLGVAITPGDTRFTRIPLGTRTSTQSANGGLSRPPKLAGTLSFGSKHARWQPHGLLQSGLAGAKRAEATQEQAAQQYNEMEPKRGILVIRKSRMCALWMQAFEDPVNKVLALVPPFI